jgi:hypothetical protein
MAAPPSPSLHMCIAPSVSNIISVLVSAKGKTSIDRQLLFRHVHMRCHAHLAPSASIHSN